MWRICIEEVSNSLTTGADTQGKFALKSAVSHPESLCGPTRGSSVVLVLVLSTAAWKERELFFLRSVGDAADDTGG